MKAYDLIVVGGGISGVAAAVGAAREGMSVLLIEKTGVLGGAMSNSLVFPFMRHTIEVDGETKALSGGIFAQMKERHTAYGDTSWETYKLVFDDMLKEAGVEILFHSCVFEVACEGRSLRELRVATKAGTLTLHADFFIDATGDGELFALAGCDHQVGRESDGYCQPMTTCFRIAGADVTRFYREKAALEEKYREYQKQGKITNPRENLLVFGGLGEGILHFNTTRVIKHDPTDPFSISEAEILARKQIHELLAFLQAESPACKGATLISIANHIGVRESRKLKGVHVLTAEELKSCIQFEDRIALGNYEIDIHNPTGTGTYIYNLEEGKYYSIPYRSLLPKEYDNLLVAGRCLSADHFAHSAVRIMPICACMGEAAGVAAALAHESGSDAHHIDIPTLQARLREHGAIL